MRVKRRPALLMVLGLLVVGTTAGGVGATTARNGSFALVNGKGEVAIVATGELRGHIKTGRLIGDASRINVVGAQRVSGPSAQRAWQGSNLRFSSRGSYRLRIIAIGTSLTASGRGRVTLSSQGFADAGRYRIDNGPYRRVPRIAQTFPFGR
jgi:hypothetical protein